LTVQVIVEVRFWTEGKVAVVPLDAPVPVLVVVKVVPLATVRTYVPLYAGTVEPEITICSPVARPAVLATVYVATEPVPLVAVTASGLPVTAAAPPLDVVSEIPAGNVMTKSKWLTLEGASWNPAPRALQVELRTVRPSGFHYT
jgi:hypothetical protein